MPRKARGKLAAPPAKRRRRPEPPRVLIVTDDFGLNTGFARVARNLIGGFKRRGYTVAQLAWFWWGDKAFEDRYVIESPEGCFRYPVKLPADYGASVFNETVMDFRPDVVLTIGDVWMVEWIGQRETRERFYWIAYFPIDAEPFPLSWVGFLTNVESFGRAVPYTDWATNLIREVAPDLKLRPIYHGVNCERFHPLTPDQRAATRDRMKWGANEFAVLTVNRNQPRKRYAMTSELIAAFMDAELDTRWHIHGDPLGDVGGDLRSVWKTLGLTEGDRGRRLSFTISDSSRGVSDTELNLLYNAADVHLSLAQEGFGLSTIEALAAGLPVVLCEGSANTELVRKSGGGVLIPAPHREWIAPRTDRYNSLFFHRAPDMEAALAILRELKAKPELRAEMAENGRAWALTQPWRKMVAAFDHLVVRGTAEKRSRVRPILHQLKDHPGARLLVREELGGIGDMLSMAVALRELRARTKCRTVACCRGAPNGPRAELLRRLVGVDEVTTTEVEAPVAHDLIVNLTDACAKGEALEIPDVRTTRAEMYCRALGVTPPSRLVPKLRLTAEVQRIAADAMEKLGVQAGYVGLGIRSAETYKDWEMSYWPQLRALLLEQGLQVLTWGEDVDERQLGILGLAAMIEKAGCVVSADTVFLHLAGTMGVPAVGLYGPSGGLSRVKAYPTAIAIQANLPCSPCWRNAGNHCYLEPTRLDHSKCMAAITPETVAEAVMAQMERQGREI